MEHYLLVSSMTTQDMEAFRNQNTFVSQLTSEDFDNFFKNCGVSISDAHMCEWSYQIPTVAFIFNSQKYLFLYSDTEIAIQDIWRTEENIAIDFDKVDINTLAMILQDSWLLFMYEKFSYEYILSYPTLGKKSLKQRNYVNLIDDSEFKTFIIDLVSKTRGKVNYFYGINEAEVTIQELNSFYKSERRFVITKNANGDILYIKFSDFEIVYAPIGSKKFFKFMFKRFGDSYLHSLRVHAMDKLHEEEVPKFIEKCTKRFDEFIENLRKSYDG